MFKSIIGEVLYLLFDVELKGLEKIKLSKFQIFFCGFIVAIILIGLLFALVYFGLNALALKHQTLGVILLLLAFIFAFIVLLKVVRIGR